MRGIRELAILYYLMKVDEDLLSEYAINDMTFLFITKVFLRYRHGFGRESRALNTDIG